jgi:hypothetical protein
LADNGGPTMTHALLNGSDAIDTAVLGTATMSDQRGLPAFNARDIGAYEATLSDLCPVAALQTDGFATSVANPTDLNQAIVCANVNGDANGGDTINLSADITLTSAYENNSFGSTGIPTIITPTTLNGMGFVLERDNVCVGSGTNIAGEFRFIRIDVSGDLTLNNITLRNGCADGVGIARNGGTIFNDGILSIENSTFSGNTSNNSGGGIYNRGTITTIQNSTFSGNGAKRAGGIYNRATIVTIQNITFSGNSASIDGSGIRNFGDGIINMLRNTLFHQNTGGGTECANAGVAGSIIGNNNLSDNASSDCPGVSTTLIASTVEDTLADNGGPTMTHALLPNSQAIDTAVGGTLTDQRGFTASNTRDIGAFETFVPVVVAPTDDSFEATGPLTSPVLGIANVSDVDETSLVAIASPANNFALGMTTVTWTVTDSQGFTDTDTQVVTIVDTTGPTITLSGDATVVLSIGDSYVDAGATAEDLVDGSINSASINVVNPVNTSLAGNYTITYDVQDNANNDAVQVTRLVKVQASIGGTINGLVNSNTVTITDGNQSLVLGNTSYTFSTELDSGTNYSVSMTDSPTSQFCQLSNNTGAITDSNISNINVSCGPQRYFIGGMASGLEIGNPVILELNTELLSVNDNAAFVFLTPLEDGENYTVTIDTLPARHDCLLVKPTGMITTNDITDVEVNCTIIDNVFSDSFEDNP